MKTILKRTLSSVLGASILISSLSSSVFAVQTESNNADVTSAEVQANLITYDLENMVGFKTGEKTFSDYEYSLNGGETYKNCVSNPQAVPNEDFEIGTIKVRLKGTQEVQANAVKLTKSDDIIYDFEDEDQINDFINYEAVKEINNEQVHSGVASFNALGYGCYVKFDEVLTKKYVNVWFYDDIENETKTYIQLLNSVENNKPDRPYEGKDSKYLLGVANYNNDKYYLANKNGTYVRANNAERTKGWHRYTWDFSSGTDVKMYVDGIFQTSVEANGFDCLAFPSWTEYHIDSITISDTDEYIDAPVAPSNPVIDDKDNGFGFTPIKGFDDVKDYEYSVDGGLSWVNCKSNPIPVENKDYATGEIAVRLKAIDGMKAGGLLVNDKAFTYEEPENESQITPSKPITYDMENMIGFKPIQGKEDYTNYEYSLDNGVTFIDCTANPQEIPNENYAVGQVQIRLKPKAMDQANNPALLSTVAFTDEEAIIYDFEEIEQLDDFTPYYGVNLLKDENVYKSGQASYTADDYGSYIEFDEVIKGKCVNMWAYDYYNSVDPQSKVYISVVNSTVNGNASKPYESKGNSYMLGNSTGNGWYFAKIGQSNYVQPKNVPRTNGWHRYTWDFTSGTDVKMYVDNVLIATAEATGFDYITFARFTQINVDDISISSTNEYIDMPDAPTNPVVNDEAKTFGFTPLDEYISASYYEYSFDSGATWRKCNSNPQLIPDDNYDIGEVQVRLKAIDGHKAGTSLRSNAVYVSDASVMYERLQNRVVECSSFFAPNIVKNDSYTAYIAKLEEVKQIIIDQEETKDEVIIEKALDELNVSISALEVQLDNYTRYEFEQGFADENPFIGIVGDLQKGETGTAFGEDDFEDIEERTGSKLVYEKIEDEYFGKAMYTLPVDVSNKIVGLAWYAVAQVTATTDVKISNEKGDYIGLRSLPGNQTRYQLITCFDGVEKSEALPIRRLNNPHILYWDMVHDKDTIGFYLDQRLIGELDGMNSFNQITLESYGGTDAEELTRFDRLQIIEENPTVDFTIPDEKPVIGYYDTYDIPSILLNVDAKYDDYKTTDVFTYTAEDKDVINTTPGGSCEGMSFGKTKVTVKTSSGVEKSCEIEVKDFKIEDVYITDALAIDVEAMGKPGQDTNNSEPVEKLKEFVLDINESKALNVVMTPDNATARLVNWTSSNPDVAYVKDGLVTGVGYGEAIITITSADGTNKTDTVKVTVKPDEFSESCQVFVATNGDDVKGNGTIENPFATIERARDEIRTISGLIPVDGAVIYFREGSYTLTQSIELNDQDSGKETAEIKYAAYKDEEVTFVGGVEFNTTEMEKVEAGDKMYNRIPEASKNSVYRIDLKQFGIQNRDLQVVGHSAGGLSQFPEIFSDINFKLPYFSVLLNDEPMTLSRFPNEDYIKTTKIINEGKYSRAWMYDQVLTHPEGAYQEGYEDDTFIFTSNSLPESKLDTWSESIGGDYGAWMIGYWGAVFSDQSVPIASIDGNQITSGLISHYQPGANKEFYVYNLIEELDIAGEWYIDQADNGDIDLYFFPPKGTDMSSGKNSISIPTLDEVMIDMYQTDNITFNGINFKSTNQGVANITGGTNNIIRKAEITNSLGKLSNIKNSSNEKAKFNGFQMCDVKNIDGGVSMSGGDIYTLERGYNFVENTSFETFSMKNVSYNPAVSIGGTGNRVTNCFFKDSPHNVVMFNGPEATIEYSEFSQVVKTAGDQGAIYTGRDTVSRGTIIKNNYFHDMDDSDNVSNRAIYLDDGKAGVQILDNIFEGCSGGGGTGGGRDVIVIGNKFINLKEATGTAPFCYVFASHIHNTALGLYSSDVDWSNPDGPYGRFEHLSYALDDEYQFGKYSKIIDNDYININTGMDLVGTENPNQSTKDWKIMPFDEQNAMTDSWVFTKGNLHSANRGNDDPEYKIDYVLDLSVASGEGEVFGGADDVAKNIIKKAVAQPKQGYEFKHWIDGEGNVVSENQVYFVTITDSNVSLQAVFEAK